MSENKEKTAGELLREKLTMKSKNGYAVLSDDQIAVVNAYCEGYKTYLDDAKTEREAVDASIVIAEAAGFKPYSIGQKLSVGDKCYYNNRGKNLFLFCGVCSGINLYLLLGRGFFRFGFGFEVERSGIVVIHNGEGSCAKRLRFGRLFALFKAFHLRLFGTEKVLQGVVYLYAAVSHRLVAVIVGVGGHGSSSVCRTLCERGSHVTAHRLCGRCFNTGRLRFGFGFGLGVRLRLGLRLRNGEFGRCGFFGSSGSTLGNVILARRVGGFGIS